MENTDKLNLPYILPSQAQKHVTHNEAIRILDSIVHLSVLSRTETAPPLSPAAGESYLIGLPATGDWQSLEGQIAVFVDGFWQFHSPRTGWRLWIENENALLIYDGVQWRSMVEGATLENIQGLGVGTSSDSVNRLSVVANATLLSNLGAGHQLKINKNAETDTASLLFQTGFSGRAELGTTGDDDWRVKTSEDGSNWHDAMIAQGQSGSVSFPNGTHPEMTIDGVADAGGATSVFGPPNLVTTSYQRANLALVKDRAYFSALYVDRPTELLGGILAQHVASNTAGSIVRAGVYRLGTPNSNDWDIEELVADFGTMPADVAGHKEFVVGQSTVMAPGWYLATIGTNGDGVQARYHRWMTPGLLHYIKTGSGSSTDLRPSGPANYLFQNGKSSEIFNGLPTIWTDNQSPTFKIRSMLCFNYWFQNGNAGDCFDFKLNRIFSTIASAASCRWAFK